MPLFRYFRESAASGRWEIGVGVIAGINLRERPITPCG